MLIQELPVVNFPPLIPSVVFSGLISGIVGALIALFSTHLSNKSAAKRQKELLEGQTEQQKQRLDHESEQKRLEREMAMRRDVYFSVIESVSKMQQFLAAFVNVSQPNESREAILTGVSPSLSKIGIIANLETVEALNKVTSYYTERLPILVEKRMYLDIKHQHKTNTDSYIQNLFQRNQQIINIINSQSETLNLNQIRLLNTEFQNNDSEIQKNQKLVEKIERKLFVELADLFNLCFQSVTEIQKLGIHFILLIRRELNFSIDEAKYRNLVIESAERDFLDLTKWYGELNDKLEEEFKIYSAI